jgi:hypothetical protein
MFVTFPSFLCKVKYVKYSYGKPVSFFIKCYVKNAKVVSFTNSEKTLKISRKLLSKVL